MDKSVLDRYRRGSAPFVVMHAAWQRSRGRRPSEPYAGELNPQAALEQALRHWNRQAKDATGSGHRTVKRVPLDFDWPIGQLWEGYLMPQELLFRRCPDCNSSGMDSGAGYNHQTAAIAHNFYAFHQESDAGEHWWSPDGPGFWCPICDESVPQLSPEHHTGFCTECRMDMVLLPADDPRLGRVPRPMWRDRITQDEVQALVDAGRLMDFTHEYTREKGWQLKEPPYVPTVEEVNSWESYGFGHDAINRRILVEARARRLGVWGYCPTCKGHGDIATDKQRQLAESWTGTEPAPGSGWQLWETTTEGSPISPVFASAEELADWCVENATVFADDKTDRATWFRLISGKQDIGVGSLGVTSPGYVGPAANHPELQTEEQ